MPNFPYHLWKHKSLFLQILHHSSVSWKITPLYFFSSKKYIEFRVLRWKFVKFLMPILKRQVICSSNFAPFFIVMTHNSSVNFQLIYFLLWIKGSYQSPNFDTFQSLVKIRHIPHVIFQTTSQFFFKLCITLQCHEK